MLDPGDTLHPTQRKGDVAPRGKRTAVIVAMVGCCGAVVVAWRAAAGADRPQPPRIQRRAEVPLVIERRDSAAFDSGGVLIEPSAPITNLFTRAEEGIGRRDWKFVIDCLQRIVEDPEDSMMARPTGSSDDGVLYESVRRRALRMLASLPPEGLKAYRLLFDGKAKGLYERARETHDAGLLRAIVEKYPLTRYGDDAADLLASWALDEGRPGEAIVVLSDLVDLVAEHDLPDRLIWAKMAAAYRMLGRTEQARAAVNRLSESKDGTDEPQWLASLAAQPASDEPETSAGETHEDMPAGSGGFQGGSDSVMPTLADSVPWRFELPGHAVYTWRRIVESSAGGAVLPALSPVLHKGRLYVRTPGGCAGLDAGALTPVWATPPAEGGTAGSDGPAGFSDGRHWSPEAPFEDYVASAISVAHSLAFSIEEGPPRPRRRRVAQDDARRGGDANRLVAYDLDSGVIRWELGWSESGPDAMTGAVFRHVPIAVGEALWVPFTLQNELLVAVLEPEHGTVLDQVSLGSLPPASSPREAGGFAMPLVEADGVVYVPSGEGVLFAVDARDVHLRWAHQYRTPRRDSPRDFVFRAMQQRHNRQNRDVVMREEAGTATFLPTAPVVSGGIVLLAPTDDEQLFAFSAAGGEFQWSVAAEDWSYLIGADEEHVWIGGKDISCLALADGSPVWSFELNSVPTGRAVRCGGLLHVPVQDGLVTVDARSGSILRRQALPAGQVPLGNLACSDTALYSVDPSAVRRFPDIERTTAWARRRLKEEPGDLYAVREMAWMHLLQDEPRAAYDVVRSVPAAQSADETLARVHVEALLAIAADETEDPSEALAHLEEARNRARTDEDRLRCTLAIAEKQQDLGRTAVAFETLIAVGLSPLADRIITSDELVSTSARLQIARWLGELRPNLTVQERRLLNDTIREKLREAMSVLAAADSSAGAWGAEIAAAEDRLRAAADLLGPEPAAASALLALADWETDRWAYERAEQLLFETVRSSAEAAPTLAAMMRLCALYAKPVYEETGLLGACLSELEDRFGESELPDWLGVPAIEGMETDSLRKLPDWVAALRNTTQVEEADAHAAGGWEHGGSNAPLSLSGGDPLWSMYLTRTRQNTETVLPFTPVGELKQLTERAGALGAVRLVHVESNTAAPESRALGLSRAWVDRRLRRSRAIAYAPDNLFMCVQPGTGALRWHAALDVPDGDSEDITARPRRDGGPPRRRAVHDGQIAVVNGPEGLYALGLVTGRRLWVRPFDVPASDQTSLYERDGQMAAHKGLLVAMPRAGKLTVMRLEDGSTVWERDLRGESVAAIDIVHDRVITQDPFRQRIHLFDLQTGRLVKQILLRQPDIRSGVVSLQVTRGKNREEAYLCGPDSDGDAEFIVGWSVQSGEQLWRVALGLGKELVQLFEPEPGYIGAGLVGGDTRVIDAATGEVLLDRRVPSVHAVVDGRMHDGTFIVQAVNARRNRWEPDLIGMDIATDAEVWRRDDLSDAGWDALSFDMTHGVIPALVDYAPDDNPQARRLGFTLIDARTGQDRGTMFDLTHARAQASSSGDYAVWPGALVVSTGLGLEAIPVVEGY